ncbi:MAG: hypothetical protein AAB879_03940, partial [Patescibacteria group bacterium]
MGTSEKRDLLALPSATPRRMSNTPASFPQSSTSHLIVFQRFPMTIRTGQTLLELLVAFTVIAVGLFAAVTLVFSNLNAVQRDSDEVIAVNLAREGVELAKRQRDSNWLAGKAYDDGMTSTADFTATPRWAGVFISGTPSFDFSANDFMHSNTDIVKTPSKVFANVALGITGVSTPFQRLLTFSPICFDDAIPPGTYSILSPPSACLGSMRKVGVRATSHVRWTRKTITR